MASNKTAKRQREEPSYAEQIKALSEISKVISSDHYLEDILRLIVTVTANVMDSKICVKLPAVIFRAAQTIRRRQYHQLHHYRHDRSSAGHQLK